MLLFGDLQTGTERLHEFQTGGGILGIQSHPRFGEPDRQAVIWVCEPSRTTPAIVPKGVDP